MKVRWTPEAEDDRAQIFDYIVADSPRSAIKMDELFSKAATRLADHPQYGRTGRIPGTREVVAHKSYCLVQTAGFTRLGFVTPYESTWEHARLLVKATSLPVYRIIFVR